MSTLRVNTLANQGGTQSTAIENAINGSAKAWVNFNGTGTVAIRASYNVSSITDNGVGDYTVNFTNAFADINFATCYTAGNDPVDGNRSSSAGSNTTSSVRLRASVSSTVAVIDLGINNVAVFR